MDRQDSPQHLQDRSRERRTGPRVRTEPHTEATPVWQRAKDPRKSPEIRSHTGEKPGVRSRGEAEDEGNASLARPPQTEKSDQTPVLLKKKKTNFL